MIETLVGGVWPYILSAVAVLVAFVGAYLRGRKDASDKAEKKDSDKFKRTIKDVTDEDYLDPDINAARDRLREFGRKQ